MQAKETVNVHCTDLYFQRKKKKKSNVKKKYFLDWQGVWTEVALGVNAILTSHFLNNIVLIENAVKHL